jgi:hypothetical protein
MGGMNDDERRTTEHITRVAREAYHSPPATPREEMWAEIEARLDRPDDAKDVVPLVARRRADDARSRRVPWWVGIAAALVIGLGIGRMSLDRGPSTGSVEPGATPMAEVPTPAAASGEDAAGGDTTVQDASSEAGAERDVAPDMPAPSTRERTLARSETPAPRRDEPAQAPAAGAEAGTAAAEVEGSTDTALPYLVATRRHLGRSESFLTSVRAELDAGDADAEVGPWARSLLVRTRLLLDSPAASDVETRRLLEDLELMLAQIDIAAEARDPEETRIIDRGLDGGNLLYRLRSATDGNIGNNARGPRASSL